MAACPNPRVIFVSKDFSDLPVRADGTIDYSSVPADYKPTTKVTFDALQIGRGDRVEVPCGSCPTCLKNRASEWANRCVNEASMYDNNLFVTLTYSPENLPKNGSLNHRDFQLFMKRLRTFCSEHNKPSPRFFMCGEYGARRSQPHYHAILFNLTFDDLVFHSKNPKGHEFYCSKTLEDLWSLGFILIGKVTASTCAYVARYTSKKLASSLPSSSGAPSADLMYLSHADAEAHRNPVYFSEARVPAYCRSSNRPGIGAPFLDKYWRDIFPYGNFISPDLKRLSIPRYYKRYTSRISLEASAAVDLLSVNRKAFVDAKIARVGHDELSHLSDISGEIAAMRFSHLEKKRVL